MIINIRINEPVKNGMFDEIVLSYSHENLIYDNNINFEFNDLYSFFKDVNSIAFDFLLITVIVYNIDRFVERKKFSVDGWSRQLEVVEIPTNNPQVFNQNKEKLIKCLNFLTGDKWDMNFVEAPSFKFKHKRNIKFKNISPNEYKKVSLFSGGLDSLIGVIDILERDDDKVILCSHKDLGKEGTDQNKLRRKLSEEYGNKFLHACTKVGLGRKSEHNKATKEHTFRSRSLLFLGQAVFLANNLSPYSPIIIPENGSITINMPLNSSRRSSCSTRTTHPTFLILLNHFLSSIGINNNITNPYNFMTKGEMFRDCSNQDLLHDIYKDSCSCAKRGHTVHWDNSRTSSGVSKTHCGMCLPCIYRRVSLFLNDLDGNASETYGTDVFNGLTFNINKQDQKSSNDFRAIMNLVKDNPSIEEIEKRLLINGFIDYENLRNYANIVLRTIEQMQNWIRTQGTTETKNKSGLR